MKFKELHRLLQPLLLRRLKAEVSEEIPKKVEVVLYHGMSALQKKLYKALLMKDLDAFENERGKKANPQNVLIQLRKCVAHPYLFTGHMYIFEGKDYSKKTSQGDKMAYDNLLEYQKAFLEDLSQGGSILRNKENGLLMTADMRPSKKRCKLSPEELKVRQKKMQERVAKRARLREEKRQKAAETEQQKKIALWEASHYHSCCLESEESIEEEDKEEKSQLHLECTDPEQTSIKYIMGDVTHPIAGDEDAIIVHCVDDSGHWGRGGLFTALGNRSDQSKIIYELAGKMKAQHRDHSNNVSGIKLPALEKGLKKIYQEAKKRNASIHLPCIGYSTKGFNWYGTECLIRKYLGSRGIPTFVYYFPRIKASSSSKESTVAILQS